MEQLTVETKQGKQVLVAKCASSEHRNDSYVLASVVAGTLSTLELIDTGYCCSYFGLYEWSTFASDYYCILFYFFAFCKHCTNLYLFCFFKYSS